MSIAAKLVVSPLYEFAEGDIDCMLHRQFIAIYASSLCHNVSSVVDKRKHNMPLCLLAMMGNKDEKNFTGHCLSLPCTCVIYTPVEGLDQG